MGKTKQLKKIDICVIEQALKNLNLESHLPEFLIEITNEQNKFIEVEKKRKIEKAKEIDVLFVYDKLSEEAEGDFEWFIDSIVENEDWFDNFADDLDDDGADDTIYFMIGDKLYEVGIHCEAEWCGDWSVRANLPGTVSTTTIKEIKGFEVIKTITKTDKKLELLVKLQ